MSSTSLKISNALANKDGYGNTALYSIAIENDDISLYTQLSLSSENNRKLSNKLQKVSEN